MAAPLSADSTTCPYCSQVGYIQPTSVPNRFICQMCRNLGRRYDFNPLPLDDRPEEALPDMATCAHHPTKRAVAVCAGTGDFICSLCRVEHNGKVYSLQFLDSAGKKETNLSFERYIDRPDRLAIQYFFLNCLFSLLLTPLVLYYAFKARRAAAKDPLYADLAGSTVAWVFWLGLLQGACFIVGLAAIIIANVM